VPPSTTPGQTSQRVALFAAFLNDEYEWSICRGAREAIEQRGGSVVCFAGAGLADPDLENRARTFVFDLVSAAKFDAVLSVSSVISNHIGTAQLEKWLAHHGLPVCSIGPALALPSISVDDSVGMAHLLEHFIAQHQHRRIAFITGIQSNAESEGRLQAYRRVLAAHGIAFDHRLVLTGDFTRESGARAVTELFDVRQVPFAELDAIIASNDYMAFGAIDELARRRIDVPGEIAVAGFDDIVLARVHEPPLTTVRQPLERLGREGGQRLLDLLEGRSVDGPVTLGTELVLRRSCGCIPTDAPLGPGGGLEVEDFTLPGSLAARRQNAGEALEQALAAEIRGNVGSFASALDPFLRRLAAGNARALDQNRRVADELATRLRLAREDLGHERLHRLSRALQRRMFGPQSLLSTALAGGLAELGIEQCVVAEFDPRDQNEDLKLAFGFDAHTLEPQLVRYSARDLVPPSFDKLLTRSVFVLPLRYGTEQLGIAVIPASDHDGAFYETLAEVFGIILKGIQVRRAAQSSPAPPRGPDT
jgi:DNA-binding LacI/PurR family transcriptional regulator